jgi:hypothetical protein
MHRAWSQALIKTLRGRHTIESPKTEIYLEQFAETRITP